MAAAISLDAAATCPCRAGQTRHVLRYGECCAPLHAGAAASTAEALMRSRYSAFVLEDQDYLLASWHPDTRPARIDFDRDARWLGLAIRACAAGGEQDDIGTVEFVARYRTHGRATRLHELSEFVRAQGRWCYVQGHPAPQAARRGGP